MSSPGFSRRRALSGAATVGLSLPVLAACGSDDTGTATDTGSGSGGTSSPSTDTATTPGATPESSAPTAAVASTADVPVGGGLVVADSEVVITQPSAGEFKAFTAVCTHTGCLVADVTTTINCPCHGSTFDVATGEPTGGPAQAPLAAVAVTVDGDQIALA